MIIKRNLLLLTILAFLLLAGGQWMSGRGRIMEFTNFRGRVQKVASQDDWKLKRKQILIGMEDAMGVLPPPPVTAGFDTTMTGTVTRERHTRIAFNFEVAPGERLFAYLYIPEGTPGPGGFPAVLALHGTGPLGKKYVDGEGNLQNRAYGRELADRGYVVIAPDYPDMGELSNYNFGGDRYVSGTMKALFNHLRCIDYLQSLPFVNDSAIGAIGHSLGGHNAIFAGAFDPRIKVVVSSCGWTLMDYYDIGEVAIQRYGGRLGPWAQERYMPLLRTLFRLDPAKIPFDFDEAIAAIAPRAFFSSSPVNDANFDVEGVRLGIQEVRKVYRFFRAEDNLRVIYPDAAHDFPPSAREEAYLFMDRFLKTGSSIEPPKK